MYICSYIDVLLLLVVGVTLTTCSCSPMRARFLVEDRRVPVKSYVGLPTN